ncbi:hypothetical protein [Paraglaciecola psychrophila]|uniref:hypothetical protein n=1 Tax=Paraglaciecola psychrophila TaxID=326544 RepID=UPI0011D2ADAC|nr:hypothetical protein [Paraglaciecola psychrophila]
MKKINWRIGWLREQDLNLRPFADNKSEPKGDCVFDVFDVLKIGIGAELDLNLRPFADNKSEPKGDCVFDVFKESVGCGSRI